MLKEELEALKLPDILKSNTGSYVKNVQEWEKRREEIKQILCQEEYGDLIKNKHVLITTKLIKEDDKYCGAKCIYREILLTLHLEQGEYSFPVKISVPKQETLCPAFLYINFWGEFPNQYLPVEEIGDNGFAVVSFCYTDITSDDNDFTNGLSKYFIHNENNRTFGKIALWAWAASHVMDYIENIPEIDKENVAIVGHSRLGKTALLASAFDERFRYTIANNAGQSGDALSRGKKGEHVKEICERFPFWFVPNYCNYIDKEDLLPFDQHFLLGLIAPRNLYVASASEDGWADPHAQFLACVAASPIYHLYGLAGLILKNDSYLEVGQQSYEGNIGYHIRKGWHYLTREDWNRFMQYIKEKKE